MQLPVHHQYDPAKVLVTIHSKPKPTKLDKLTRVINLTQAKAEHQLACARALLHGCRWVR